MWKRAEVVDGQRYQLALCQNTSGERSYALHRVDDTQLPTDAVFMTDEVPNDLLLRRDFEGIASTVRLTNGNRFWVEAHGVWLTHDENIALSAKVDHARVPWLNGLPAKFPPR